MLAHGISGATQLNVSSAVVVASLVAGVALAASAERQLRRSGPVRA